jgi:hypothetical protein
VGPGECLVHAAASGFDLRYYFLDINAAKMIETHHLGIQEYRLVYEDESLNCMYSHSYCNADELDGSQNPALHGQ